MPNAMQVINAGLYADRVVECILKWQAGNEDKKENRHECRSVLKKEGFSVLGSGYYGFVVDGPADSSFVVKVCIDGNDGYPMYARWAKANPQPGVVPVWLAERITDTCFVAVLPKLLPVDGLNERESDAQQQISYARYNQPEKLDPGHAYLHGVVRNVLDTLGDFANEDMHYGNWMQDAETGMIYLTDPFACLYVDRDKAESTAARGVYIPPLKDQFDLFDPTYEQRQAGLVPAKKEAGCEGPAPFGTTFAPLHGMSAKKSFPMPAPWVELIRPCLGHGRGGDECNCAKCRKPDQVAVKPRSAGKLLLGDKGFVQQVRGKPVPGIMRDGLRNRWFVDGIECGGRTAEAWQVAKPLMRREQQADARLLEILSEAAGVWGIHNLFPKLPVKRLRYFPAAADVMRMNTKQLAQPVQFKERMELDFNELERRVMADAGRCVPDGRFDVRIFDRPIGWLPPNI